MPNTFLAAVCAKICLEKSGPRSRERAQQIPREMMLYASTSLELFHVNKLQAPRGNVRHLLQPAVIKHLHTPCHEGVACFGGCLFSRNVKRKPAQRRVTHHKRFVPQCGHNNSLTCLIGLRGYQWNKNIYPWHILYTLKKRHVRAAVHPTLNLC